MDKATTIVVPVSDTHVGSTVGLMHIDGAILHDGQTISCSPLQRVLWQQWMECWDRIKTARKSKRLIVVFNGDPVEGIHHDTTQIWSSRVDEHEAMFVKIMKDTLKFVGFNREKGDRLFFITGTEEHGDSGSQSEERIAVALEAEPQTSRATWDKLMLDINDVVFDIGHHPQVNPGRREWTTENAMRSSVKSFCLTQLDAKGMIPRYIVRSHAHRYVESGDVVGRSYRCGAFITPCFLMQTGWSYKYFADSLPDIGIMWFYVGVDGMSDHEVCKLNVIQDEVQVI